jgi:RNA polymerase sigma factor (sigma-70 family)
MAAAAASNASEACLVVRAKDGSSEAFATLFRGYRDRIAGYVRTIVADGSRADDIVQEVFISALRSLHTLEDPAAFKCWIYQIAKNACLDDLRRSRRRAEFLVRWDDSSPYGDRILDPSQSAYGAVSRKEVLDHVRQALGGLPRSQHQALVLREVAGLSYDEIGKQMRLSRPAVESVLFRARRGLRGEYSDISTGARCRRMQRAMAEIAGGLRGMRDRRAILRHVRDCPACRHQASVLGFSGLALAAEGGTLKRALSRAAAFVPLPIFFNRRAEESEGAANAASFGAQAQGAVSQFTAMGTVSADHAASAIHKAVAVVAAVAVVGGGGVAVEKSGVPFRELRPALAKTEKKRSAEEKPVRRSSDAAAMPLPLPAETEAKGTAPAPAKPDPVVLPAAPAPEPPSEPAASGEAPVTTDQAPAASELKTEDTTAPATDAQALAVTEPAQSGGAPAGPATDAVVPDASPPPDTGGAQAPPTDAVVPPPPAEDPELGPGSLGP